MNCEGMCKKIHKHQIRKNRSGAYSAIGVVAGALAVELAVAIGNVTREGRLGRRGLCCELLEDGEHSCSGNSSQLRLSRRAAGLREGSEARRAHGSMKDAC